MPLPSGDIPDVTLAREDGRDSRGQKVILDPDWQLESEEISNIDTEKC